MPPQPAHSGLASNSKYDIANRRPRESLELKDSSYIGRTYNRAADFTSPKGNSLPRKNYTSEVFDGRNTMSAFRGVIPENPEKPLESFSMSRKPGTQMASFEDSNTAFKQILRSLRNASNKSKVNCRLWS
jgi:hypothetical protein